MYHIDHRTTLKRWFKSASSLADFTPLSVDLVKYSNKLPEGKYWPTQKKKTWLSFTQLEHPRYFRFFLWQGKWRCTPALCLCRRWCPQLKKRWSDHLLGREGAVKQEWNRMPIEEKIHLEMHIHFEFRNTHNVHTWSVVILAWTDVPSLKFTWALCPRQKIEIGC